MTASQDVPIVQTVEAHLQELLTEVQHVKTKCNATSLYDCKSEPEYVQLQSRLQNLFTIDASSAPAPSVPQTTPTSTSHQLVLESAARNLLYFLLSEYSIDSPEFDNVWCLLDLLILSTSTYPTQRDSTAGPICDSSLPLWIIEELFDSQTIIGCRRVFDYLESSWSFLLHATGMDRGTGISTSMKMILLRSCNELLRRLSRAEDTVFCGRIFMFLFGSFPLGDKSSVNLRGEFHVENTTVFDDVRKDTQLTSQNGAASQVETQEDEEKEFTETQPQSDEAEPKQDQSISDEADKMDIDSQPKQESTQATSAGGKSEEQKPTTREAESQNQKLDAVIASEAKEIPEKQSVDTDTFYTIFWSLQHVFSNPTKLFEHDEFQKFKNGLELTVEKFKSAPKVLQTHGTPRTPGEGKRSLKRRRSKLDDEFASNFNPKYLTSRDLFELEMSDMTFQRHILVQALILIDFLLSLTPKAKKKLAELKAQRAMQYNFTLTEDDAKWAASTRTAVASYLQDGPDGKFYYRMADTVLARDKNWVRWKVESCPPIEKSPMETSAFLEARNGARRACAMRRMKTNLDGAVDIDFLSDVENVNHLGTLKDSTRFTIPTEDAYLREIDTVDLDLEMATEAEKPYMLETKASAIWRTLRLVSKRKLDMFDRVDETSGFRALVEPENLDESEELQVPEQTQEQSQVHDLEAAKSSPPANGTEETAMEIRQDATGDAADDTQAPEIGTAEQDLPGDKTVNNDVQEDSTRGGQITENVVMADAPADTGSAPEPTEDPTDTSDMPTDIAS